MRNFILSMLIVLSCSTFLRSEPHEDQKSQQNNQGAKGEVRPKDKPQPKKRPRTNSNPADMMPYGFLIVFLANGSI